MLVFLNPCSSLSMDAAHNSKDFGLTREVPLLFQWENFSSLFRTGFYTVQDYLIIAVNVGEKIHTRAAFKKS